MIIAVSIVAGIGLIIGLILAIASAVMSVPTDEKVEALTEALPGANCGACGYSGCAGYAKALACGEAKNGACAPGGEECVKVIAEILGEDATALEKKVAVVLCMGTVDNTEDKVEYQGVESCAGAMVLGGKGQCNFGCLGLGDCAAVCPYGAVSVCRGVARIDMELCRACAMCVSACPKKIITLVPLKEQAVVRCSNTDKGAQAKKACKAACIGCKKCEKVCDEGAVTIASFKASVDPTKCGGCQKCEEVCPQGSITGLV
ncbi:MAG: RnfABCDGE type electron transport complex subunit B [Ruminococcus sp.]|nr:RnfABCDGE type electron transport complex subunit B [Ruminococcus sp.]